MSLRKDTDLCLKLNSFGDGFIGRIPASFVVEHTKPARLRKRRQSGVVDLDGSLGRSCISKLARTWDETNIYTKGTARSVK